MQRSDYVARGFPGDLDRGLATVAVAGIDRVQAQSQLRFCEATEGLLYAPLDAALHYRPGARPQLEQLAAQLPPGPPTDRARAAMRWVHEHVTHPHHVVEQVPPDRALGEEEIVDSGVGWCNEQTRVLVGLCEVMGIPGRICFVYHANLRCGHTAAELLLDGRWAYFDATFDVAVELPDGRLAEARELSGSRRELAHRAYRPALADYYARLQPHVELSPGWRAADRPDVARGGDLLAYLGFTDYLVEGVVQA